MGWEASARNAWGAGRRSGAGVTHCSFADVNIKKEGATWSFCSRRPGRKVGIRCHDTGGRAGTAKAMHSSRK